MNSSTHEEHEDLEQWESAESRRAREAWRGLARRELRASREEASEGAPPVRANVYARLAAAAIAELRYHMQIEQFRAEVNAMRAELEALRKAAQSPPQLPTDATFEAELGFLEKTMPGPDGSIPDDYDLGPELDEWS